MVIGAVVGRLWRTGAKMVPKWAVLPVSAIAEWTNNCVSVVWAGGPGAWGCRDDATSCRHFVGDDEDATNVLIELRLSVAQGFPPCQALLAMASAEAEEVALRRGWRGTRLRAMRSLPPMRLETVALS